MSLWTCSRGAACTRRHPFGPGDVGTEAVPVTGASETGTQRVLPMYVVAPTVAGPAEDLDFDVCPAADIRAARSLLDLWTACDGSIAELVALVGSPSAALIDAWGVIRSEMGRLRAELRRRED